MDFNNSSPSKKRKTNKSPKFDYNININNNNNIFPTLKTLDYYTKPSLTELIKLELINPGYCTRVTNFTIGRVNFGYVQFIGETDVRVLDLDRIVKFNRNEVVVYDEDDFGVSKPNVGDGLNKPAVVTLVLKFRRKLGFWGGPGAGTGGEGVGKVVERLRVCNERQGAEFVSFDPSSREWRFKVKHFSRFGLSDDDEDDIVMDDVGEVGVDRVEMNDNEDLSHSLPAHLGLDPVRMKEMKMLMFSGDDDDDGECENYDGVTEFSEKRGSCREKSPFVNTGFRLNYKPSPPPVRKTPIALLEYKSSSYDVSASNSLVLSQQNKGLPRRVGKVDGFYLDGTDETPVSGYHSRNIVDAGLFMGRSFRVGWGPNGVLIHGGKPVGSGGEEVKLSSVIYIERVAMDKVTRDARNEVKKEAADLLFDAPLDLFKSVNHKTQEIEASSSKLNLQKVVCDHFILPDVCRRYIEVIEKQLEVPDISPSVRVSLMHQVTVWELIKVLFSERETSGRSQLVVDDSEEMMQDGKVAPPEIDTQALPLVRRAEFSYWLQESVYHRVQEDVSCLNDSSDLEHILLLLTGRQLDAAVELAASRGDVRLACLLSEAGGSMVNRADITQQLELWRINGMDFKFFEEDRVRLLELLSGNIDSALAGRQIDWKRFLGLLMWYELQPGTHLPDVFRSYQASLTDGRAPYPVPVYIDEGPVEETTNVSTEGRFDLAYYLMLLHADEDGKFNELKSMFSAFASTNDPLDHHMIWHQRVILEAIGAFASNDLHVLDMAYVSQLLCLGKCHWAIYVVLHMPYREDFPNLHSTVIREILFQYCDTWSTQKDQCKFIEDLGVPLQWLHEAMGVYFQYYGDLAKALEHYIQCGSWQKAHSIFITSIAHSLFLSAKDTEIWRLATSMEDHKLEIDDWDLGAGVYVSFYLLRSSLREGDNDVMKLDSLESKDATCREFFDRLNKSLEVFGKRLPEDARVAYSKMSKEICGLLLSDNGEGATSEIQFSCFDTIAAAPVPEDTRSCYLQDAISLFTSFVAEAGA